MPVSRRKILQGSLPCAAGMVPGSSLALAQDLTASLTPDERKRMANLAADFMGTYEVPSLSVAIAIKGKPPMLRRLASLIERPAKRWTRYVWRA
jgi:hypothetical protein